MKKTLEELREELYVMLDLKDFGNEEVLYASQQLDALIIEYYN